MPGGSATTAAAASNGDACRLYVRHVPQDMSGAALRRLFETAGRVMDCFLQRDPQNRGWASLKMVDAGAAQAAIRRLDKWQARTATAPRIVTAVLGARA